jgi:hypothetical protein
MATETGAELDVVFVILMAVGAYMFFGRGRK